MSGHITITEMNDEQTAYYVEIGSREARVSWSTRGMLTLRGTVWKLKRDESIQDVGVLMPWHEALGVTIRLLSDIHTARRSASLPPVRP